MTTTTPPLPPAAASAALSASRRARDLDALATEVVDVLVVGAGVTGTGVALDAASRGLTVALVDAGDLASGTSRWSSKLVHGGLRYLAHGDVRLAHESAAERRVLMTTVAPHLVRPLPVLTPLTAAVPTARAATVAAALGGGELLTRAAGTSRDVVPGPRRVRTAEARRLAPGLAGDGPGDARLRGGLVHWEGQLEDDARLVVALARTAAAYGARVVTRCRAEAVGADGAVLRDRRDGGTVEVRARHVVNATGVWADALDPSVRLRPSRGAHVVVRSAALGHPRAALSVPVAGEWTRFALVLPQPDGYCYVGLTDAPHAGPVPDPAEATSVSPAERDELLALLAGTFARPLGPDDVVGAYAGFRPLLEDPGAGRGPDGGAGAGGGDGAGTRTVDLSRRHAVLTGPDGLLTVTGGKLTTYRRMAADVVDRLTTRPCRTDRLPLVGAGPVPRSDAARLPTRLVRRFGTEAADVAALAARDPGLADPVAPGLPVLGVEVLWARHHEGALDADDVLDRRTRLGLVPGDAETARPAVAALLDGATATGAPVRSR